MNQAISSMESDIFLELDPSEDYTVDSLITMRRSLGSFRAESIDFETVKCLLRAGRYAPSSFNTQPWRYIVLRNGPDRDIVNADLEEWGASWAIKAPILLVVVSNLDEGTVLHALNYATFDCGMAVQNVLLQATHMGLAAHPIGFHNHDVVRRSLHIPDTHQLLLFIAVGWPSSQAVETNSCRYRKPMEAIATWDLWDGAPVMDR